MTVIFYEQQVRKNKTPHCRNGGSKPSLFTPGPVCCISGLNLGAKDERLRYFLINGNVVAFNWDELRSYLKQAGLPTPRLESDEPFDIGAWLVEASQLPAEATGIDWAKVNIFARLIGLNISFALPKKEKKGARKRG